MVALHAGRRGRPWRRRRGHVLSESDVCWWCGHGGANAVDHITPITAGGSPTDPDNLAPIHGIEGCPVCPPRGGKPRVCNGEKGNRIGPPPVPGSRPW